MKKNSDDGFKNIKTVEARCWVYLIEEAEREQKLALH